MRRLPQQNIKYLQIQRQCKRCPLWKERKLWIISGKELLRFLPSKYFYHLQGCNAKPDK
jgi:hypothetical protein